MSRFILRNNAAALFSLFEWGRKGEVDVNEGFKKMKVPLYFMTFQFCTLGQELSEDDVMNAEADQGELPAMTVYSAHKYEGKNAQNPMRVGTSQGRDLMGWAEFLRLFKATGAKTDEGRAVADNPAVGLAKVAMRVGALEGSGPYEAKNVLRRWAPSMDVFKAEDAAAQAGFAADLASGSTTLNPLAPGEDKAPAPVVTLARKGQAATTQAAPAKTTTRRKTTQAAEPTSEEKALMDEEAGRA